MKTRTFLIKSEAILSVLYNGYHNIYYQIISHNSIIVQYDKKGSFYLITGYIFSNSNKNAEIVLELVDKDCVSLFDNIYNIKAIEAFKCRNFKISKL